MRSPIKLVTHIPLPSNSSRQITNTNDPKNRREKATTLDNYQAFDPDAKNATTQASKDVILSHPTHLMEKSNDITSKRSEASNHRS